MAVSIKKFRFTLCKDGNNILVTKYCEADQSNWVLIREECQPLDLHPALLNKRPTSDAIQNMVRQKTIALFLTNEEAQPYMDDSISSGELSEENSDQSSANNHHTNLNDDHNSVSGSDMRLMFTELMKMQMDSFQCMMKTFQDSLVPLTGRKNQKMEVNKFDGRREDAKTWLIGYEKACDFNGWSTDDAKINNLKSYLDGIAVKWFNSRLIECSPINWSLWKDAFLDAFGQNRVSQASIALNWEYRGGPMLEYYYEKQRLLQLAFPDMNDYNFITLVLIGLPDELQKQISVAEINTREEFRKVLSNLKPLKVKENSVRFNKKPDKTGERPKTNAEKVFSIANQINARKPTNEFKVVINDQSVTALFDTGSHFNLVSSQCAEKLGSTKYFVDYQLKAFDGSTSSYKSAMQGEVVFNAVKCNLELLIVESLDYDLLLGVDALAKLKVNWNLSTGSINLIKKFGKPIFTDKDAQREYPSLFETNTSTPICFSDFKLAPDSPTVQSKPYRLSRNKYLWAKDKINELMEKGIIQKSKSEYASPVVIVPKENGQLRLCQDYRQINKYTVLDPFPFPIIDDIISGFGGCTNFTKIDLKDGFWQIGLTPATRKYSAFVLPFGQFEMTRLPFGWKNSPPTFQREITNILSDLLDTGKVAVYIDDICIGGENSDKCGELTGSVLNRLALFNVKISQNKCQFNQPSVTFLGRVIDGFTKTTKEESVAKVKSMKRPTDLHSLRCFTGLTGHFRSFIPNYADVVRPLDKLKQKDTEFIWSQECEDSYNKLVEMISSNPILCTPNWSLPFELSCDASYYGTGAILYQRDKHEKKNRQLRVIGYYSYTFTKTELNYNTTEKECLAVIRAIQYFRSYLEGKEFIVNTDHQALTHLMTLKEPKNRLGRWQTFLMTFNLKMNHRSGKALTDADALSRLLPTFPPNCNSIMDKNQRCRIKVQPNQIKEVLSLYHDDPISGGHDGISRTIHKIGTRFYWDRMKEDIVKYIKSCDQCQKAKAKFSPKKDIMISPYHSTELFEAIHLDYGELAKKREGISSTRSFLVLVDEASRLIQAVPMKEDTDSLIRFLSDHLFLHRIKKIVTDNGRSFTATKFKNFALKFGIKLKTTSPYSPWSNGLAERCVQKIKLYCELYPNYPRGWKGAIEAAAKHNNRAYNRAIGCSPFFKAFGKIDYLPADEKFGIGNLVSLTETPFTKEQQESYRKKLAEYANRNANKPIKLEIGDQILVFKEKSGKQKILYGPFPIIKIKNIDGVPKTVYYDENGKENSAHIRNVKVYHPRSDGKN